MEKENLTTIQVRKKDVKKLERYKEYGSQPMWVVIKKFLEENSVKSGQLKKEGEVANSEKPLNSKKIKKEVKR